MNELEIPLRSWRVTSALPSGFYVWFDPARESLRLYRIPTSEQRRDPTRAGEVDEGGGPGYLDKVDSVSGPESEAELAPLEDSTGPDQDDLDLPF